MKYLKLAPLILGLITVFELQLDWQTGVLPETGEKISVNGFNALPGATLLLALPLLVMFGARYWSRIAVRVAVGIATLIGLLGATGAVSLALNANPALLQGTIATKTGVSDWESQVALINDLTTNRIAICLTAATFVLLAISNLTSARKINR